MITWRDPLLSFALLFWVSFWNGCGLALNDLPWLNSENVVKSSPPIVFVYLVPSTCKESLPEYMKSTINQAINVHSNLSQVILISNFKQCSKAIDSVIGILTHRQKKDGGRTFYIADSETLVSAETKKYINASSQLFNGATFNNHLWRSSALRFFLLLDLMRTFSYDDLLHIEADNMLYRPLSKVLVEALRRDFPLAATPLIRDEFITASVLWTSGTQHLHRLTSFFLDIAYQRDDHWKGFLQFLWKHFCCRKGGLFANATNDGIKPYAMNEMAMLAYYHTVYPSHLRLLPVLPLITTSPSEVKELTSFSLSDSGVLTSPNSYEVVNMVWDSGSWGQYLGGTWNKRGKDVGFIDPSHVIGKAIDHNHVVCRPKIVCTNGDTVFYEIKEYSHPTDLKTASELSNAICHTAPVVQCPRKGQRHGLSMSPLFNLHVHSKRADIFVSGMCQCNISTSSTIQRRKQTLPNTLRLPVPMPMIPYPSLSILKNTPISAIDRPATPSLIQSESLLRLLLLSVVLLTLLRLCWSSICSARSNTVSR